jgi:urease accessory protein
MTEQRSRQRDWALLAAAVVLSISASPLSLAAHEGGSAAGLFTGLYHPISGLDHVLAMVAVGIWGAQLGAPAIWVLPVTFPVVMAFGGMAALLGVGLPGVEVGIAVSALLLGAMVAFEHRPDLWVAIGLVGFFAVFHGHAHGAELPEGESGLLYSIGFVVSTGLLHATGIGIGEARRLSWGAQALRVAGGVIAVGGVWFTWGAFSG